MMGRVRNLALVCLIGFVAASAVSPYLHAQTKGAVAPLRLEFAAASIKPLATTSDRAPALLLRKPSRRPIAPLYAPYTSANTPTISKKPAGALLMGRHRNACLEALESYGFDARIETAPAFPAWRGPRIPATG